MRQAEEHRRELGVGVRFRWVLGGSFSGTKTWEWGISEAKTVVVSSLLFADDTTIVGNKHGRINARRKLRVWRCGCELTRLESYNELQ